MKEVFDNYFKKLNTAWQEKGSNHPKTVYLERCDVKNGVYIPDTREEGGYVQWQPKLQNEPVDFESLEKELGFKIHKSIKDFFSIYWFEIIEGHYEGTHIWLDGITPPMDILEKVREGFNKGSVHHLKDDKYFGIGAFDPMAIFVNNRTGEVTAALFHEEISEHMADSIEELMSIIQEDI